MAQATGKAAEKPLEKVNWKVGDIAGKILIFFPGNFLLFSSTFAESVQLK